MIEDSTVLSANAPGDMLVTVRGNRIEVRLLQFENTYPSNSRYTHVGIYAGKDEKGYNIMLHAGNPIGYASIDINYWQSHSPQYARIVR